MIGKQLRFCASWEINGSETEKQENSQQWDEKLKDWNNCAAPNSGRGVSLSVSGVLKRPASVWSLTAVNKHQVTVSEGFNCDPGDNQKNATILGLEN